MHCSQNRPVTRPQSCSGCGHLADHSALHCWSTLLISASWSALQYQQAGRPGAPVLRQRRHDGGARDDGVQRAVKHGAAGRGHVARVQLQVYGRVLYLAQRHAARPTARGAARQPALCAASRAQARRSQHWQLPDPAGSSSWRPHARSMGCCRARSKQQCIRFNVHGAAVCCGTTTK